MRTGFAEGSAREAKNRADWSGEPALGPEGRKTGRANPLGALRSWHTLATIGASLPWRIMLLAPVLLYLIGMWLVGPNRRMALPGAARTWPQPRPDGRCSSSRPRIVRLFVFANRHAMGLFWCGAITFFVSFAPDGRRPAGLEPRLRDAARMRHRVWRLTFAGYYPVPRGAARLPRRPVGLRRQERHPPRGHAGPASCGRPENSFCPGRPSSDLSDVTFSRNHPILFSVWSLPALPRVSMGRRRRTAACSRPERS